MGSQRVIQLENKSNDSDLRNKTTIEELKGQMTNIEDRVTTKLLSEIEPSLKGMKDQIETSVSLDLRRIVQEELALQKMAEAKIAAEDDMEEGDLEKNKKIQKSIKTKNTKTIE